MSRQITNTSQPSMHGQPQVSFRPDDFSSVVWGHGYDIICEKAIRCPCQGNSDSPLPSCQNCHGSGYVYINPERTKALVTGLNKDTKYTQWAPELMGTAAITVMEKDKDFLAYFNRITIEDEYASFTEMVVTRGMVGDEIAVFLSYAPIDILGVYVFESITTPLIKLNSSSYEILPDNPYCLKFIEGIIHSDEAVSVLYKHRVEYHIIDLPHEIRASLRTNKQNGNFEVIKMPVQAVGRRTHLVDMQRPNYDGSGIIYNDSQE